MKKPFSKLLAATAILLAAPAYAEQHKPTTVASTQVPVEDVELGQAETGGPALWKVFDEDTTIYLFGTVHALPEGVDWYNDNIADALGASDILITEVLDTPELPMQMQSIVARTGMLPAGTTLRGLLDTDQKASYEAAMTTLEMPVSALDKFEPWYASVMLALLPIMKEGYSPDSGVEKVLSAKSGEDRKSGSLETLEFQMGLFDQLPLDSQIKFLIEAAEGVDTIKPTLDKMVAEWLEGDADGLAQLMNEGLTDPVLANALLYDRNITWAEWIDTRLDTPGTVFIAVGAGHLAGKKSVQDALKVRGIETIRVQ